MYLRYLSSAWIWSSSRPYQYTALSQSYQDAIWIPSLLIFTINHWDLKSTVSSFQFRCLLWIKFLWRFTLHNFICTFQFCGIFCLYSIDLFFQTFDSIPVTLSKGMQLTKFCLKLFICLLCFFLFRLKDTIDIPRAFSDKSLQLFDRLFYFDHIFL